MSFEYTSNAVRHSLYNYMINTQDPIINLHELAYM